MSLRNSPQLSSSLLDAARSNARHSTGPRTAAGKLNSKMNALKHGERSGAGSHYDVMRALGEDPARFEALKRELCASFSPGGAFAEKQVDDLAQLYWRRERVERAQTGLMRRALLDAEDRQHRRRKEIEGSTFEAGQAINVTLGEPTDPAARLRLLLSFLAAIRVQVHARSFLPWQAAALEGFYQSKCGWRAARLCRLLGLFAGHGVGECGGVEASPVGARVDEPGGHTSRPYGAGEEDDALSDDMGAPLVGAPMDEPGSHALRTYNANEPADEQQYNEMVLLIEEEMDAVEAEFEYEEKLSQERAAIERDACLAPAGEEWRMLLRREEALDRAIDRKIKLLLSLQKTAERSPAAELRSAPAGGKAADLEAQASATTPTEESTAEDQDGGAPGVDALTDEPGLHEVHPGGDLKDKPSPSL